MSARDELFHFATTQSMASEEMAERLLAKFRAEALAGAKLSADLAEEDYRRMVSAASQMQKKLHARIAELEALTPAPIQTCQTCGAGYDYGQPCSTCTYKTLVADALKQRQVTGRCSQGHTFEDCTCGGTAQ